MQLFKPSNYFEVREALIQANRTDFIGGCEGLIPAEPPKEAVEAKRRQANEGLRGDHSHTVASPAKGEKPGERGAEAPKGYRPEGVGLATAHNGSTCGDSGCGI